MLPAWMLLIERTRNTDVIMVPAWMLSNERTRNTDVIMLPAWMLLMKRATKTDVFMPSAFGVCHARGGIHAMRGGSSIFEPSTGPKVLKVPRRPVPKGLGENAFFARLRPVGALNRGTQI